MRAFISIDYDLTKDGIKYNSVKLSLNEKDISFNTGNFVKDWYDCKKTMIFTDDIEYTTMSSSVDHFIMDGAPYDSAYLHMENDKGVLKYIDRTDENWYITQENIFNGIEFFVKENTQPTWDELKETC